MGSNQVSHGKKFHEFLGESWHRFSAHAQSSIKLQGTGWGDMICFLLIKRGKRICIFLNNT